MSNRKCPVSMATCSSAPVNKSKRSVPSRPDGEHRRRTGSGDCAGCFRCRARTIPYLLLAPGSQDPRIIRQAESLRLPQCLLEPFLLTRVHAGRAFQRSRTSSSDVCERFSYQMPTASKGSGVSAQTTWSTCWRNSSQASGDATGTATMILSGCCAFSAHAAAIMLAPVAKPSSTTMTVRFAAGSGGRPSR